MEEAIMALVPNAVAFQRRLEGLPVRKCQAGETLLSAGTATGRLLILKSGAVEVLKDGVQLAEVSAPGAVFGELALQPHTADVRATQQSEFHVADAQMLRTGDSAVSLYVAAILARRLDAANRALIEIKHQLLAGEPRRMIGEMVQKVEQLLTSGGDAGLVYAGYPYDPFAGEPLR
jgi:CRP/FNR family transcriptional regulator, cyclic AMP receptor protein